MDSLLQTLQSRFRLPGFRPHQREIIDDVLAARDTLCVMPTGAGKSLCFQLPAVVRGGLTVVISPLISLMADQARQLKQLGIPALVLNSTQSPQEQRAMVAQLVKGFEGLLYVAPERFASASFQALATRLRPRLFVVDEAHCISSWDTISVPTTCVSSRLGSRWETLSALLSPRRRCRRFATTSCSDYACANRAYTCGYGRGLRLKMDIAVPTSGTGITMCPPWIGHIGTEKTKILKRNHFRVVAGRTQFCFPPSITR